jgi:hypothetical protein
MDLPKKLREYRFALGYEVPIAHCQFDGGHPDNIGRTTLLRDAREVGSRSSEQETTSMNQTDSFFKLHCLQSIKAYF